MLHNHVRAEVTDGRARFAGTMPDDERLNFSFVLPLRNEAELDRLLERLYDPSSPDYRQFLDVDEFTERFGPTAEDFSAVVAFARASGFEVVETPANRLIVPVSGTVQAINSAFHVRMSLYQHPSEDRTFFSPDREPSLALSAHVAHISGLNNFSLPTPLVQRTSDRLAMAELTGSGPGGSYLASDMRAAYYGGTQLTGVGQAVGLLEFGGYYLSDVDATFSSAGQNYSVPVNNVLIDGANAEPIDDDNDSEQVLDIVQAIGMAPGLSQVRVYIGKSDGKTVDDAHVLNAMAAEDLAKALSSSWSWIPDDPKTDDVFFKEFAAQGQSFFVASGDLGAYDAAISPYFYPAEDDYVTSVGGTHLTTESAGGAWEAETAWNAPPYGSGGGVSPDGIPIPPWQSEIATLSNGASKTLRNVPDVAMEGDFDNFSCAYGRCYEGFAGTSFAAPRWAAFTALVNQQATEAGTAPKGGVGFLNPSLYSIGAGLRYIDDFHDIVSGTNLTEGQPLWYSAETGYDLVTGWGSPAGQNLIDDLAGKQVPGFWLSASSGSVVMNPGASGSATIDIVDAGSFTGTVQLAVTSTLPKGVTAKWSRNPTSGSSVLTLTAASNVANLTTPVTITGKSGSIAETTQITLIVHTPSFALVTFPDSFAMNPGSTALADVFVDPLYGFNGSVKLAVSGLPKGVTATLGTNPTTGTSLLTIDAGSTAALGTTNITITGTSGSLTATTTLALTIHLPEFILTKPGDVNIGRGGAGQTFIEIAGEYGFSGAVNFSVAGLPKGVTASFYPNPSTSFYSNLTLIADSSVAFGSSTVTVVGTSGALRAATTFKLNILPPAFIVAVPAAIDLGRGLTATSTVAVLPEYGFTGSANFAISGLPSGVTASFSLNPAVGDTALVLTASDSAPLGQSKVTITGTSGALKASTSFLLGIAVPAFSLSNPGSTSVGPGSSSSVPILVTPEYGFTRSVNLSVSGLPSGVTASISPNPVTGTAMLAFNAGKSAPLGTSTVIVKGVSGAQSATVAFALNVVAPAFALTDPGAVTLGAGTSVSSSPPYPYSYLAVTVNPEYGFLGSVNLAVSGLPAGVTASFSPNPATASSTLTLTASSATKPGTSTATIVGTSGGKTATATFPLTIAEPGFTLSSGSVELGQGTSSTTTVNVSPQNGFAGTVTLSASGLPRGVTASFNPDFVTGSTTLTLTASADAAVGSSTITVTGISGIRKATATIPLQVATPTFKLSAYNASVDQGETATTDVYIDPAFGFTGNVQLSASGLPAGVTASFLSNPASSTTLVTFTASSTAALGNKTVTITGTSGSQTGSATLTLDVLKGSFYLFGPLTVNLTSGSTVAADITVAEAPGTTGNVQLAVSGLPSGVTGTFSPNPASGASALTLTAASTAVSGITNITITGTLGTLTAKTTMQLDVQSQSPPFSLSTSANIYLAPGTTANDMIDISSPSGFAGLVNLSVSGLPQGVTASISPNPATGRSTMNLTASSTAHSESATVTIKGTSGSLTASTKFVLTVSEPSFTIGTYSSGFSLSQGSSQTEYFYVSSQNGFSGNVNFSTAGLPSGVTASFSPASTNGSTLLTLTASSSASLGQYNAVITGISGKLTSSSLLNVTVAGKAVPSFTIGDAGQMSIGRGSSWSTNLYVNAQNGFNGSVQFSVTGLPSGVSASISPNPTTYSSILTLTATDAATLGQYNATITATCGKQTISTPFAVAVYSPSFAMSATGVNLNPGSSGQAWVNIGQLNGFLGSVHLSISGLPSGVSASFLPNPVTNQSAVTLSASSTAAPGQYNLKVTGVSGNQTQTALLPLQIVTPSFTLNGDNATVGQGSSTTVNIYVESNNGFNSPVEFQATGLPSGVTASFSPNPSNFSSTITLTAAASATPGNFPFTVTGKSGSQSASFQSSVTVGAPSFSVSAGNATVGQGSSVTTYVSLYTQFGFNSSVTLSATGLPSGVTASFSPNPITSYDSTVTLAASSSVPAGTYALTITGTSGSQTSTSLLWLTVVAPTFTLQGGNYVVLGQGNSASTSLYISSSSGFSGVVSYGVSGLPIGVTASFSPVSSSNGSTTLTLTASKTAPVGIYTATLSARSGSITSTAQIQISIGTPSFSISTYYSNLQLGPGSTATAYVYVNTTFGFDSNIQMSAAGLPSGVTASFSPNPTTYESMLTLTASDSVVPGQYNITVTGTSGSQKSSETLPLTVYAPSFTLYGTESVSLNRGSSATGGISVNPEYGFTGSVHLALTGLPSGVTASFSPNPTNPTANNSTLTLTASSTASLGLYNLTLTGTSGAKSASSTIALGIYQPSFTLYSGGQTSIGLGQTITTNIQANPQNGFKGSVHFAISGLPSGITASFSPNPTTSGGAILTLKASGTASLGQYNLTITGTSGSLSASSILNLTIYIPTFTLSDYNYGLDIGQGTSTTTTVQVNPEYGFTGAVQFTASGLPSGVTASFSPNPATTSTTMTLTASSTAALGQYSVIVTGTSGTQSASTTVGIIVLVPTFSISGFSGLAVGQGTSMTSTVYVTPQYGFSGQVNFAVTGLPSGVTASFSPNPATTNTTMTLTASSAASLGQFNNITLIGTSGSQSSSVTFTLVVVAPTIVLSGPDGVAVVAGQNSQATFYVEEYGFSGNVQLSLSGLPDGVTASFSPNPTADASVLTLTAASTAKAGQYPLTVTVVSGSLQSSWSLPLTVANN